MHEGRSNGTPLRASAGGAFVGDVKRGGTRTRCGTGGSSGKYRVQYEPNALTWALDRTHV